jgi:predicted lipoprotein with Yx(FWY)xxD motif
MSSIPFQPIMFDMTKLCLPFVSGAAALALIGCGSGSSSSSDTSAKKVEAGPPRIPVESPADTKHVILRKLPHLGFVLTNGGGHTLYAFVPDKPGTATCTGSCAATWPPIRLTHGMSLDTSPLLGETQVALVPDPEGGRMVKYGSWVLHTYVRDTSAGAAKGQGLHVDGGNWYVISPRGKLITTKG